uniref:Uncharacterized protein n=1 Tax=Brassica campestris TaxID=3711 RepID=M4EWL8_BRACM
MPLQLHSNSCLLCLRQSRFNGEKLCSSSVFHQPVVSTLVSVTILFDLTEDTTAANRSSSSSGQIDFRSDDIYPYISWTGNYDVVKAQAFRRDDDVEDDRIKVLMEMIKKGHDFSEHVWETEENEVISLSLDDESAVNDEASVNVEAAESDDDFQTPKGSKNVGSRSKRGKKRLPDRGMEKRKHKVLASGAKQAPFNEDMKAFMTQLFEHNFSGMEQRIQKQMAETFEQMRTELKQSRKEASVEVELKIGVDLWEAAHDPIFAEVMTRYVPSPWERSEVFDLEDD